MAGTRRLIYQLNVARHSMMKAMNARCLGDLGISVNQLTALMAIAENDGCSMKDLAATLMLDKSAITGLARRMQGNGLIVRKLSDRDARVSHLDLTDKGRMKLDQGKRLLQEANRTITGAFSERELATVSRFLDHLSRVFSERK